MGGVEQAWLPRLLQDAAYDIGADVARTRLSTCARRRTGSSTAWKAPGLPAAAMDRSRSPRPASVKGAGLRRAGSGSGGQGCVGSPCR